MTASRGFYTQQPNTYICAWQRMEHTRGVWGTEFEFTRNGYSQRGIYIIYDNTGYYEFGELLSVSGDGQIMAAG